MEIITDAKAVRSDRIRTFRDLTVWQNAFELCVQIYRITDGFPNHERFGLAAELRKTARSVPYNIAEGHRRSTREYVHFLTIACGSIAELETQLLLGSSLAYLTEECATKLLHHLAHIDRMLASLMRKLRKRLTPPLDP